MIGFLNGNLNIKIERRWNSVSLEGNFKNGKIQRFWFMTDSYLFARLLTHAEHNESIMLHL